MSLYERKGWYTIELPEGWVAEEEDPVSIHHPEGVGALQISAQAPRPLQPGDRLDVYLMLRGYLRGTGVDIADTESTRGRGEGFDWALSEYEGEDPEEGLLYWRVWMATNHDLVIFMTYACRPGDKDRERAQVDAMVASLRLRDAR